MNVCFCRNCRSLILADFRFCPYCGAATAERKEALDEVLEEPFRRMGEAQAKDSELKENLRRMGSGRAESESARASGPAPKEGSMAVPRGARGEFFARLEESLDRLEIDMDLLMEEFDREGRPKS